MAATGLLDKEMIELYHCADARSFRALWTLDEMGLPYRLHLLPFPPRQLRPEFVELNPLGTVPLFIDGIVRMTESAAIPQYLVTRYGPSPLAVSMDESDYALWLDWQHRGEATLTFPQTVILRYSRLEPADDLERVIGDYTQWFLSRLRHVTRALADREWLCADRFTTADISVGYALLLAENLGLSGKFSPEICAYWNRLTSREAFISAKHVQGSSAI
jgi:glutathione S-transferase